MYLYYYTIKNFIHGRFIKIYLINFTLRAVGPLGPLPIS
jgi:hypothetical protein